MLVSNCVQPRVLPLPIWMQQAMSVSSATWLIASAVCSAVKVERLQAQVQSRRTELNTTTAMALGSASASSSPKRLPPVPPLALDHLGRELQHADQDAWATPPTVDALLARIVQLWEHLCVPLVYRCAPMPLACSDVCMGDLAMAGLS